MAIKTSNVTQRTALCKAVATILNKYNKANVLESFIGQTLIPELHLIIRQEQASFEAREAALIMYTWITKALVLGTNSIGYDMTGELMNIFSVPRLGKTAADGFNLVIGEQRDVLTKETFAVLRVSCITHFSSPFPPFHPLSYVFQGIREDDNGLTLFSSFFPSPYF